MAVHAYNHSNIIIIIITATKIGELLWCSYNNMATTILTLVGYVLWQRFEQQTFQSLGKYSTNELPCHLDVVKIWILIGQSVCHSERKKGLPVNG